MQIEGRDLRTLAGGAIGLALGRAVLGPGRASWLTGLLGAAALREPSRTADVLGRFGRGFQDPGALSSSPFGDLLAAMFANPASTRPEGSLDSFEARRGADWCDRAAADFRGHYAEISHRGWLQDGPKTQPIQNLLGMHPPVPLKFVEGRLQDFGPLIDRLIGSTATFGHLDPSAEDSPQRVLAQAAVSVGMHIGKTYDVAGEYLAEQIYARLLDARGLDPQPKTTTAIAVS